MPILTRPATTEFAPYYSRYIDRVPDGDLLGTLEAQQRETQALLRSIPESRADHRYAPEKWSIREVVGHVADTERIFAYRALRMARGDTTPLAAFDENAYVANADFGSRPLAALADDVQIVRAGTLSLLRPLSDAELMRIGTASDCPISARALAWIIAGHELHHVAILRERYL
jgi:hypothetical protein